MNIWYIHPYAGGPRLGRYWRPFHLGRAWQESGHEVLVITSSYHHLMDDLEQRSSKETINTVNYRFLKTIRYEGNGIGRFASMLIFSCSLLGYGLIRVFRNKPDLIIYSSAHPFGFLSAWIIKKLSGAKLAFEVRDLWPLSLIEVAGFKPSHPIVRVLQFIERFAYKKSDKIISLLPGAKDHLVDKGMDAHKFLYVPNGFSLSVPYDKRVEDQSGLLRDISELKKRGAFIYFYAGAFGEPNAMHKFVDALEKYHPTRPHNAYFVLVGKGEQLHRIKERCTSLGMDYVKFYSQVDKRLVVQALSLVDAGFFVMHDLPIYRFGVSLNKLYDYMAASLPVVASYRAFNDPIKEAGCGISVGPDAPEEFAAALASIYSWSAEERSVAGARGYLYLKENFEYSVLANRIVDSFSHK